MTSPVNHSDLQQQLEGCFALVFPDLSPDEIPTATMDSVEMWDSLATLTLVGAIEDEFQIRVPLDELPDWTSFQRIARCLAALSPASRAA